MRDSIVDSYFGSRSIFRQYPENAEVRKCMVRGLGLRVDGGNLKPQTLNPKS